MTCQDMDAGVTPFAAGLALWLCMLKPHLLLPFAAALLLWIVTSRAGRVLAGAVVALALSTAAARGATVEMERSRRGDRRGRGFDFVFLLGRFS